MANLDMGAMTMIFRVQDPRPAGAGQGRRPGEVHRGPRQRRADDNHACGAAAGAVRRTRQAEARALPGGR
ncbi:hypothetical protein ACU4GD_00945 [Cupriavidus basilensis]